MIKVPSRDATNGILKSYTFGNFAESSSPTSESQVVPTSAVVDSSPAPIIKTTTIRSRISAVMSGVFLVSGEASTKVYDPTKFKLSDGHAVLADLYPDVTEESEEDALCTFAAEEGDAAIAQLGSGRFNNFTDEHAALAARRLEALKKGGFLQGAVSRVLKTNPGERTDNPRSFIFYFRWTDENGKLKGTQLRIFSQSGS